MLSSQGTATVQSYCAPARTAQLMFQMQPRLSYRSLYSATHVRILSKRHSPEPQWLCKLETNWDVRPYSLDRRHAHIERVLSPTPTSTTERKRQGRHWLGTRCPGDVDGMDRRISGHHAGSVAMTIVAAPVWGRAYVPGILRNYITGRYKIGLPGHPLGNMFVSACYL